MNPHYLLVAALSLLACSVHAATPETHIPEQDAARFLVDYLDLATFRNSLGPRRTAVNRTFTTLGIAPSFVSETTVVLEDDDWYYSLEILRRTDINRDGIEDLEVCFVDRAKQGTYATQHPILLTRYAASGYVVALQFEVDGCERYVR